jgi:hypothetical protein
MGISIGNTYAGCPSCADDIVLLLNDQNEMQEMLSTVYDYSSDHRFLIHPIKSNTSQKYQQAKCRKNTRNNRKFYFEK